VAAGVAGIAVGAGKIAAAAAAGAGTAAAGAGIAAGTVGEIAVFGAELGQIEGIVEGVGDGAELQIDSVEELQAGDGIAPAVGSETAAAEGSTVAEVAEEILAAAEEQTVAEEIFAVAEEQTVVVEGVVVGDLDFLEDQ
jgi:hypothetical protein